MWRGKDGIYNRFIKRGLDILISALVLIAFCWLYAIIAILVRVKMGSPVFFSQERPGKIDSKTGKEKIFKLYKFRSMTDARDKNGELLPADERLTHFGKLLRATSLDELPELWNIFVGDMSVVGPRPLWSDYLQHYNQYEHERHLVRPGLTGLAQVNGRNVAPWKERFRMDHEYLEGISLGMDLKILFKTVKNVISHKDVEFVKGHQPILEYFENREQEQKND